MTKIFDKRKQKEESKAEEEQKKAEVKIKNINNLINKRKIKKKRKMKEEKKSENKKEKKHYPLPVFLPIFDLLQNNKNKKNPGNPIKKKEHQKTLFFSKNKNPNSGDIINEKNKKNKIHEGNIINRLPTKNISERKSGKIIIEENGLKNEYTKEELYEMYLQISKYIDSELNTLPYKKALKWDQRTYCKYYSSLIKTKHLLIFSFMPAFDYNSRILKMFLFFFNFTVNFVVNALFFNDDTMHKIYIDGGSFNFIYNIPQILYSSLISGFINGMINLLALSNTHFIELRHNSNKKNIRAKAKEVINVLKIKFAFFFVVNLVLLVFFWFYLACFCAVYKNTQIHLIKDTLISFGTSMIYPIGIYLIPGFFRICALRGKNKEFMYGFSKLLQLI